MVHDSGTEALPWISAKSGHIPPHVFDVLFVNTNEKNGGAARAAYRIFSEIRRRSMNVHYLTLMKEDRDPDVSGRLRTSALGSAVRAFARLDRIPLYLYPQRQRVTFSPEPIADPSRAI